MYDQLSDELIYVFDDTRESEFGEEVATLCKLRERHQKEE